MYLEELVNDLNVDGYKFATKIILNHEDIIDWLKTIAGFANCCGGNFFIGIEGKTNKLTGLDRKRTDNERNYFISMVSEHLNPRPKMKISLIKYLLNNDERFIIHINVEESELKPVILNFKDIPSIFMRRGGFTDGVSYEEIIDMSIESKKMYNSLSLDLTAMNDEVNDNTSEINIIPVPTGTKLDEKVLSFCYHKPHKVSEIAKYLRISDSTYLRKQVLENMVKNGYLEKTKVSRSAFYKTSRDMVTIL